MEMTLGKRIADLRRKKEMTQEELAAIFGISAQAVSKWENDVTAGLLSCFLKKEDVHLSAGQMRRLFRILRQYKRNHPEWILAEVDSADGSHVTVKL